MLNYTALGDLADSVFQVEVGEKVVYPGHGVSDVVRIESRAVADRPISFFVLRPLGGDATILVPTESVATVGVRPVIRKDQAQSVYKILRKTEATPTGPWNRRHRVYQERLKSGQPEQVAAVVRDLLRTSHGKELSFSERKMLDAARSVLVTEMALALRKPHKAIDREIDRLCR